MENGGLKVLFTTQGPLGTAQIYTQPNGNMVGRMDFSRENKIIPGPVTLEKLNDMRLWFVGVFEKHILRTLNVTAALQSQQNHFASGHIRLVSGDFIPKRDFVSWEQVRAKSVQ